MESSSEFSPKKTERTCFPLGEDTVNAVLPKIPNFDNQAAIEEFVDQEEKLISNDASLEQFLDIAFGLYQERSRDADKDGFFDGAAIVHRLLREQGTIPLLKDEGPEVMNKLRDEYEAQINAASILTSKDLVNGGSDELLGDALIRISEGHPTKKSFLRGAEILYTVLRDAENQGKGVDFQLQSIINST